jgi:hypothetical protein
MAEPAGDGGQIDAGGEERRGHEVSEVVQPYAFEADIVPQTRKPPGPGLGAYGPVAIRPSGEQEAVGGVSEPEPQSESVKLYALGAHELDRRRRKGDRPDRARMGMTFRRPSTTAGSSPRSTSS